MTQRDVAGNCWNCQNSLMSSDYGRQDSCPKCGRDTRACKGCVFYDAGSNNDCRESQADRVLDKEKANFCDYFRPSGSGQSLRAQSTVGSSGQSAQELSKNDLIAAAEALFKKK